MSIKHQDVMTALENILKEWNASNITTEDARESIEVLVATSKLIKENEQYPEASPALLAYDKQGDGMSLHEVRQYMERVIVRVDANQLDTKRAEQLMRFLNIYSNTFKTGPIQLNNVGVVVNPGDVPLTFDETILAEFSYLSERLVALLSELAHAKRQMHVFLAGVDHEWDGPQEQTWQKMWKDGRFWRPKSEAAKKEAAALKPLSSRNPL